MTSSMTSTGELNPKWTRNSASEDELLFNTMKCARRIGRKGYIWDNNTRAPPTTLRCGSNNEDIMNQMDSIISFYKTISFIGDSILAQQYFSFLCIMRNHSLTKKNFKRLCPTAYKVKKKECNYELELLNNNSKTKLRYFKMGLLFQERELYDYAFPMATDGNATYQDLVIVNLGVHYWPWDVDKLVKATEFVYNRSQNTNATILFVESTDPQWQSTTGEFVKEFGWYPKYPCKALDSKRIKGEGNYTGPSHLIAHYQNSVNTYSGSKVFQSMYPEYFARHPEYFGKNRSASLCVPYCLPANWRNDVTNAILSKKSNTTRPVTIVPVWRQLIAHGVPHNIYNGDCTHKSMDAIIAMNQQLLREMKKKILASREK